MRWRRWITTKRKVLADVHKIDIKPFVNSIVYRMLFETADHNYIGARASYFEQRDWDFWWLALHAVEKYLKTMLLVNGASAKAGSHNVITLLSRVKALDPRLTPPSFVKPRIRGLDDWPTYSDELFYTRLNDYGTASNRYGTYGYTLMLADLLKVDQLVFWARRHARPREQLLSGGRTIDWVDALANNPEDWLQRRGPLEQIAGLKPRDRRRWPLTRLNAAFFPRARHELRSWRSSASNPPIAEWCVRLTASPPGSDDHRIARKVLQWVVVNMKLVGGDEKELRALLAAHVV